MVGRRRYVRRQWWWRRRRCCRDLRRFGLRRRRRRWWRRWRRCLGERSSGGYRRSAEQRQVATHLGNEEGVLVAAVGDVELPRLERRSSAPPYVLHDRRLSAALHCHPFHVRAWLNRRVGDDPCREDIQHLSGDSRQARE